MSEQAPFNPADTINAPHAIMREWGDNQHVDPAAETIRIEVPDIHSKDMAWYPGKSAVALAGVIAPHQSSERSDGSAGQLHEPNLITHVETAAAAEEPIQDMNQMYVFKTGPDGKRVAIPYEQYLAEKAQRKQAQTMSEEPKFNDVQQTNDMDKRKQHAEEQASTEAEQQAQSIEATRAEMQARIDQLDKDMTDIEMSIDPKYRDSLFWSATYFNKAVSTGEADSGMTEYNAGEYNRVKAHVPEDIMNQHFRAYAAAMSERSKLKEQMHSLSARL